MKVWKLTDPAVAEGTEVRRNVSAIAYVSQAVMDEQRDVHRNVQEVHRIRRYNEIVHPHKADEMCGDRCELWEAE